MTEVASLYNFAVLWSACDFGYKPKFMLHDSYVVLYPIAHVLNSPFGAPSGAEYL